jgi:hypothetical protein
MLDEGVIGYMAITSLALYATFATASFASIVIISFFMFYSKSGDKSGPYLRGRGWSSLFRQLSTHKLTPNYRTVLVILVTFPDA